MINDSYLYRKEPYDAYIHLLGYRRTPGRPVAALSDVHAGTPGAAVPGAAAEAGGSEPVLVEPKDAGTGGNIPVITRKESWRIRAEEKIAAGKVKPVPLNIIPSTKKRDFVRPVWTDEEIERIIRGERLRAA